MRKWSLYFPSTEFRKGKEATGTGVRYREGSGVWLLYPSDDSQERSGYQDESQQTGVWARGKYLGADADDWILKTKQGMKSPGEKRTPWEKGD